jgi:hypothetical protein
VVRSDKISLSLPECPTKGATEAELELWQEEVALLRPRLTKKYQAHPSKRREILVKAELEKTSAKIIPRFRAEMMAQEITPEAEEALQTLSDKLESIKAAGRETRTSWTRR